MKFHVITKFGMINLVVRLILCLNEKKNRKSLTSVKGPICSFNNRLLICTETRTAFK